MQALAASSSSVQRCVAMRTQQPRQVQRAAPSPIGGASSRLGCETRPFAPVARLAKSSRSRPLQPLCARPPPMRDNQGNVNTGQMLVFVPPHPLIKHWLAIARNEATPPPVFRHALSELGRILIYEAMRDWLPTLQGQVGTPLGVADVEVIDPSRPVKVVPILRAGLVLLEQAATIIPHQETYHVGVARDEKTLQPTMYLNKLPESIDPSSHVLVSDPMLATGGTIGLVLEELVRRGASVNMIRVVGVVAAPPALKMLSEKYPGLRVYVSMIDENLDDKGRITPGLGDAGDRAYGN